MLDKIEIGHVYTWDQPEENWTSGNFYFITAVSVHNDVIHYYEMKEPRAILRAPYDTCTRILRKVS